MVPAPTASDVPKKERRLTERFGGLGFDVDVVTNDAVDLSIDNILYLLAAIRSTVHCASEGFSATHLESNAPPSLEVESYVIIPAFWIAR
jgi:hypothetical protein